MLRLEVLELLLLVRLHAVELSPPQIAFEHGPIPNGLNVLLLGHVRNLSRHPLAEKVALGPLPSNVLGLPLAGGLLLLLLPINGLLGLQLELLLLALHPLIELRSFGGLGRPVCAGLNVSLSTFEF